MVCFRGVSWLVWSNLWRVHAGQFPGMLRSSKCGTTGFATGSATGFWQFSQPTGQLRPKKAHHCVLRACLHKCTEGRCWRTAASRLLWQMAAHHCCTRAERSQHGANTVCAQQHGLAIAYLLFGRDAAFYCNVSRETAALKQRHSLPSPVAVTNSPHEVPLNPYAHPEV